MTRALQSQLSSKNPIIRKCAQALLRVPKFVSSFGVRTEDLQQHPPVFINSVPKSGTHLLMQIVEGLPHRVNYGAFIASMTSSFRFRERTPQNIHRMIEQIVPGEIVRGHLFYDATYDDKLDARHVVHYFIFRDPRDVALSGAHYVRSMNSWHKLHRYFRSTKSIDEALLMTIGGLQPPVEGVDFPDIGQRYARYRDWIHARNCFSIRFEDLQSDTRPDIVRRMAEFYADRTSVSIDVENCAACMLQSIAPTKSHTFRSGEKAGWRKAYKPEHRRLFHEVAGDLLIDLGYESDDSWVHAPQPVAS